MADIIVERIVRGQRKPISGKVFIPVRPDEWAKVRAAERLAEQTAKAAKAVTMMTPAAKPVEQAVEAMMAEAPDSDGMQLAHMGFMQPRLPRRMIHPSQRASAYFANL